MGWARWVCVLAAFVLNGCAALAPLPCGARQSGEVAELLFGRDIAGGGTVSEDQWRRFVDQEITPRFPQGITLIDAAGQWRDPTRSAVIREKSKLVMIALAGEATDRDQRLDAIAEAYKRRFRQQSVGVIVRPACISF
jgi:hypothetical protein